MDVRRVDLASRPALGEGEKQELAPLSGRICLAARDEREHDVAVLRHRVQSSERAEGE